MKISNLITAIIGFITIFSCHKKEFEEISDLDKIKHNNKNSYPSTKMDSAQAIHNITQQKLQELLDLSTIYASGNRNTEVDSLIYNQISSYFLSKDSTKISPLINELDSLKVKTIRVKHLDIKQQIKSKDTLDIAHFTLEYLDKNKNNIGFFNKKATYILKKSPIKFVKEFKFYFINFDLKENTSEEVTK
jgi:hypothetical protein